MTSQNETGKAGKTVISAVGSSGTVGQGTSLVAGRRVHASSGSRNTQDERFRSSNDETRRAEDRERQAEFAAAESYVKTLASAGFMAQLAALHLGDAADGERRVRRDVSLVSGRAEAAYRTVGRLNTAIEPGFLSAVLY